MENGGGARYKAQSRFLAESSKDKAVKTTDVNHKVRAARGGWEAELL